MLKDLNTFAEQNPDLISEAGYSNKRPNYYLELATGTLSKVELPEDGKKTNRIPMPDLRRNSTKPIVPDDTAEYLLGLGDRGKQRQQVYLDQVNDCYHKTKSTEILLLIKWVESCQLGHIQLPAGINQPDLIAIVYNGQLVNQNPEVKRYIKQRWRDEQETADGVCIITGETTQILSKKVPMVIKRVPNTEPSGAMLTSFEQPAFQSYGWKGNLNAPIGIDVATNVLQAIQFLTDNPYTSYRTEKLSYLFWGDGQEGLTPDIFTHPDVVLLNGVFVSLHNGVQQRKQPCSDEIKLLVLAGNRGRIAVKSTDSRPAREIQDNVFAFYESQKYHKSIKPVPYGKIPGLMFRDPKKEYTISIELAFLDCLLKGKRLPQEIAIKTINRIFAERKSSSISRRAQILATFTHMNQLKPDEAACLIGKLAFHMHNSQKLHMKKTNDDTNVMRSIKTLASCPRTIFPRLYLGFISHHNPSVMTQKRIQEILSEYNISSRESLSAFIDNIPATMPMDSQIGFVLGFAFEQAKYWDDYANYKNNNKNTEE